LNVIGVSTLAGITTVVGETLFTKQLSVSGVSTFTGITTVTGETLFTKQASVSGIMTANTLIGTKIGVGTGAVRSVSNGITTSFPSLDVVGDVRIGSGTTQGLILTAPNGNLFRLIVDDSGSISVASTSILT
jgi:hypothetical protein